MTDFVILAASARARWNGPRPAGSEIRLSSTAPPLHSKNNAVLNVWRLFLEALISLPDNCRDRRYRNEPPDFSRHVRSIRQTSFSVRCARRVDSARRRRSRVWCGISNTINERVKHASRARTDPRRVLRALRSNRARHTTFRFAPRGAIDKSRAPNAQGAGIRLSEWKPLFRSHHFA